MTAGRRTRALRVLAAFSWRSACFSGVLGKSVLGESARRLAMGGRRLEGVAFTSTLMRVSAMVYLEDLKGMISVPTKEPIAVRRA